MIQTSQPGNFSIVFVLLATTTFQFACETRPQIKILRTCPSGVVTGNSDGSFCIGTLNTDYLSATDVLAQSLSVVSVVSTGSLSASTITGSFTGNAATATTAVSFSGSLVGDVTGTQGATAVSTVGGQTAANVAAATSLANAATNLNTASTIVKRDASGNFAAGFVSMTDAVLSLNLILSTDPSTSTAGNIIKGSNRFIHDAGTNNIFVGSLAGNFTTTGTGQNSALGVSALTANTTGANNSAFGYNALDLCTTGSNNIAIGSSSGGTLTTGSNNIYMGASASTSSESNTIRIGTSGSQTTCYIQGISGATLLLSGAGVLVTSAGQLGTLLSTEKVKRNIKDMNSRSSNVLALRPVTFTYREDLNNTEQFGLIAEEVEKIFPEIVVYNEDGQPLSVQYHILPILLLNEIKKQQNMIDILQAKTDDLDATNQIMMSAIATLQEKVTAYRER